MFKESKGITLIALVVTIIVLLILAAVSISAIVGENGIVTKAKDSKIITRAGEVQEIVDMWKSENYATQDVEWENILTEDELLLSLIDSGKVEESEINRQAKTITIGSKVIDYSIKNAGIFGVLYGYGEYAEYIEPMSYNNETENEYSDLVYFSTDTENITQLSNSYYYEYYELCFNTTGKVEEKEGRTYIQTINYAETTIHDLNDETLLNKIDIITFEEKISPDYISFYDMSDITFNNFENLDTSKITDMSQMFSYCYIENIDLSKFDTSNVSNMSKMFSRCDLISIDMSGLNLSKVTNTSNMFDDCYNLQEVKLPSSLKTIGSNAFASCDELSKVDIPSDSILETIGDDAFNYCLKLSSITLPENLKSIGDDAFYYNRALKNITIPSSVTSIGSGAFHTSALENITILGNIKSLKSSTFQWCKSLKSVILPESLESIEASAFYQCTALTNIVIPNKVTTIGNKAFYECSVLTSVTLPDSLISIGAESFKICSTLTKIFIPSKVETIGSMAFYDCPNITIYCAASSQPSGWNTYWKSSSNSVLWSQTR